MAHVNPAGMFYFRYLYFSNPAWWGMGWFTDPPHSLAFLFFGEVISGDVQKVDPQPSSIRMLLTDVQAGLCSWKPLAEWSWQVVGAARWGVGWGSANKSRSLVTPDSARSGFSTCTQVERQWWRSTVCMSEHDVWNALSIILAPEYVPRWGFHQM